MVVKTFSSKWCERRLYARNNKVSISNDVTSDLKDESSNTFSISAHEISKSESDYVSENMDDAEYANLTAAEKKNFLTGMTLSRNTGENTVSHTSLI